MKLSRSDKSRYERIGSVLLRSLRSMDQEAARLINGFPYGLYGYKEYLRIRSRKYEDVWSVRLLELAIEAGFTGKTQVSYPNRRAKKCDLVFEVGPDERIWIEVKTAWKASFNRWEGILKTKNPFYEP